MKPLPRREFLRISGAALATTGAGSSIAGAAASDDSRLASESVCIGTIGPGAVYLLNGLYDGGFAQLMAELTTATRSRKRHKVDRREIAALPGISQIPLLEFDPGHAVVLQEDDLDRQLMLNGAEGFRCAKSSEVHGANREHVAIAACGFAGSGRGSQ